jgi:hypothetical protein
LNAIAQGFADPGIAESIILIKSSIAKTALARLEAYKITRFLFKSIGNNATQKMIG